MLLKRLLVFICPLLLALGLELVFLNIGLAYILLPILYILFLISLKFLVKARFFSREFLDFLILPSLLFLSLASVLFIVSSDLFRHFLIILFAVALCAYLENVYLFFFRPQQYQPFSFENFSSLLNLVIFFLTAISLNAFIIFLNLPVWLASLILIAISTFLIIQGLEINKIRGKQKFIYLIILDLLLLEFFWCINFLPANFYVDSAILTILYYFSWEIILAKLKDNFEIKMFWRFVVMVLILIFFIAITSSWI